MDLDNCQIACNLISSNYINQGSQALVRRRKLIKTLLSQRRLPSTGWDDALIEMFINELALMDSNNFIDNVGIGEREARVASELVNKRHYRLAHGIGRSGEIASEQPKAAGSSLLFKLTNEVVRHALILAGIDDIGPVLTLPLATGMALTTTMLALRELHKPTTPPSSIEARKYVLWTRIDQKTCLKCIIAAGYTPLIVPMKVVGDQVVTDINQIEETIDRVGTASIACILTTTSCFAPRTPDDIVSIAKICQQRGIPHVINNAYGIQSATLCSLVTSAWRKGRVDAVIQSTDKNFMVPVGGAVVIAPKNRPDLVDKVNSLYPGRASMSPILDVLITLLHWGVAGWQRQLQNREHLYTYALNKLQACAKELNERVLEIADNPISMGMTLNSLVTTPSMKQRQTTLLGSMLFARCTSGARVIVPGTSQTVSGFEFKGYGASIDGYPHAYVTLAAAIGTREEDIDEAVKRLKICYEDIKGRTVASATNSDGGGDGDGNNKNN